MYRGFPWLWNRSEDTNGLFTQPSGTILLPYHQPASSYQPAAPAALEKQSPSTKKEKLLSKKFLENEKDKEEDKVPSRKVGGATSSGITDGSVSVLEHVPHTHAFKATEIRPTQPGKFLNALKREISLLSTSLPPGIMVKTFQDRLDVLSAMIVGPACTPYEDGLFLFDLQLPDGYPDVPPRVHYRSQCIDRLNPNLYQHGKVCVSLLGTWHGSHASEGWTAGRSNLLQVLVSIQGLILVDEPYYNEPFNQAHRNTLEGFRNSRDYNESALIRTLRSAIRLLRAASDEVFAGEILQHFRARGWRLVHRLESWLERCRTANSPGDIGFHLFPPFEVKSIKATLSQYRAALLSAGIPDPAGDDERPATKTAPADGGAAAAAHLPTTERWEVLQGSSAPFQGSSAPFQGSSAPFQGSSAPFQGSSAPFQGSSAPFQGSSAPFQGSSAPFQGSSAPFQGSSARFQGSSAPVQGSSALVQGSSAPSQYLPFQGQASPVNDWFNASFLL